MNTLIHDKLFWNIKFRIKFSDEYCEDRMSDKSILYNDTNSRIRTLVDDIIWLSVNNVIGSIRRPIYMLFFNFYNKLELSQIERVYEEIK